MVILKKCNIYKYLQQAKSCRERHIKMITPAVCDMYVWNLFTCWDNSDCPKPLLVLVGSWCHFLPWIYFYFSLSCLQGKGGSGNKWLLSFNDEQSEERSGKAEDHPKLTLHFVRLNIFVEKAFLLEKQGNWLFLFFLLFLVHSVCEKWKGDSVSQRIAVERWPIWNICPEKSLIFHFFMTQKSPLFFQRSEMLLSYKLGCQGLESIHPLSWLILVARVR